MMTSTPADPSTWVVVRRFPDYAIRPDGTVRFLGRTSHKIRRRTTGPREVRSSVDRYGYRFVMLQDDEGRRHHALLHRLLVEAFIGPIADGMQINHKNGVKGDNRLDNLEIVTATGNCRHKHDVLGRACGDRHYKTKLTDAQVLEIAALPRAEDARDVAKRYGVTAPLITAIWSRRARRHAFLASEGMSATG